MMMKPILMFFFFFISAVAFSQHREDAEKLVTAGVQLEDSGKSELAIAQYQQALQLDKDNLMALTEMAYSFMSLEKYDEAARYCKRALKIHKGEEALNTVYVTYGNALDAMKEPAGSIAVYNEGIKQFPDYFQLYFNKGISLAGMKKNEEALVCFERSATLNPEHAGSQIALGNVLLAENKKIPALMAYCRFLIIEPESKRSIAALENLENILTGHVTINGKNSITIHVSPDMLVDKAGQQKANNFSSTELLLAMGSAMDHDSLMTNQTPLEKFIRKFEIIVNSLKNTEKDNYGFYWDYYVPYFTELTSKNLTETFANIVFASSADPAVSAWLTSNQETVKSFYEWSDAFKWRIN
jgi:tetratricopeptide (TPR) repeat protein